ncbi:MAG: hypothetical protein AAGJ95_16095 [Cyanobacteria bacterium J06554_11]
MFPYRSDSACLGYGRSHLPMPKDTDGSAMVSAAHKNGQAHNGSAVAVLEAALKTNRAAALLAGVAEATRLLLAISL